MATNTPAVIESDAVTEPDVPLSDEKALFILQAIATVAKRDGFDAARTLIDKWVEGLREETGKYDQELKDAGYTYLRELEEELEGKKEEDHPPKCPT